MDTKLPLQKEELWPSVFSIIIPLVQLLSVIIVNLSDTLHIARLLVFPDILNLVNLLTMIVIISVTGWFWYWRSNIHFIVPPFDNETKTFTPNQKIINKLNSGLVIASLFLLLVFISVTIAGYKNLWFFLTLWGILQYLSYSLLLIMSGIVIYIWIFEFIQKKQTFRRENFIRNLIATLGDQGFIERPALKILKNEITGMTRTVEVEINDKKLILNVSFDGLEISKVFSEEEFYKSATPQTKEQLKVQIMALSAQLNQLNAQLDQSNTN